MMAAANEGAAQAKGKSIGETNVRGSREEEGEGPQLRLSNMACWNTPSK